MSSYSFRAAISKILSRPDLAKTVAQAKQQDKTVVFTNGCFDILHIGHVRYLQEARSRGDMLVVGINSDDSVRGLKGPTRPYTPELERAEVLAALECVDYVTLFSEDTPISLIREIKPNVHIKGGDYKPEDLPEADVMHEIGGKTEVIPFSSTNSEGWSTTNTIEKINRDK